MSVDDAMWGEILRLWTTTSEAASSIGRRYGVSHQQIVGHARKYHWPARQAKGAKEKLRAASKASCKHDITFDAPAKVAQKKQSATVRGRKVSEGQLLQRLFEAIERIVLAIEDRMSDEHLETLADTERLVRTLGTLIQNIGKIQDVDDNFKRRRRASKDREQAAGDAERRRQELAERVFKILQSGPGETGSDANRT